MNEANLFLKNCKNTRPIDIEIELTCIDVAAIN